MAQIAVTIATSILLAVLVGLVKFNGTIMSCLTKKINHKFSILFKVNSNFKTKVPTNMCFNNKIA